MGSFSLLQRIFLTQELNRGLLHCRWILYQLSHQDHENPDPPVFGHSVVCFSPGSDSCLIRYLKNPAAAVSSSPSRSPLRKEPCLLRQPKEPWTPFPTDQSRERGLWVGPGSGGLGRGLTWAPSCTRPPASLSRSPSQGHPARRAQIPAVASSSPLCVETPFGMGRPQATGAAVCSGAAAVSNRNKPPQIL